MSRTFVGVYWGARRSDLVSCAALAARHFQALSAASSLLGHWYLRANRKPKEPTEVDVRSNVVLEGLLAKGVNRTDIDRKPIPELGWRVGFWNGDAGGWSAATDVHCGLFTPNPNLSNSATLSISGDVPNELATTLLRTLVEIWNPDRGVVQRSGAFGDADVTLGAYATSVSARLFGPGERVGRGRLVIR